MLLGIAHVPDGVEMRLIQHGDNFSILLETTELMSTLASHSEEALATMTHERLGATEPQHWLIGGYGMGYTLRAALSLLERESVIVVAEIVPEIIDWARGPMESVTAGCLDDERVVVVDEDVAHLIGSARSGYDAILLDVDNGPEWLTRLRNERLYGPAGLADAMRALKPGGILAVWSAWADPAFTERLTAAGFRSQCVEVRARPGDDGSQHVIWFASRP